MYQFKYAVRTERNNGWTHGYKETLSGPLPPNYKAVGTNKHGDWFRVELPASVWALVISSDEGITAGIYHSPAKADDELKEAFNAVKPSAKA